MSANTYSLAGSERRTRQPRRGPSLIDESIERRSDRRANERRDSPRAAARFWVRDPAHGGISEVFEGDLSMKGASFMAMHPPHGEVLEVGMWLPGTRGELKARARVISRSRVAGATSVHLRFEPLPPAFSSALALYLLERDSQG